MFIKIFLFIKYNVWMSSPWVLFRLMTATVIIVSAATSTITTMIHHHQPGREKLQELHILRGFYILVFKLWINNMSSGCTSFLNVDVSILSVTTLISVLFRWSFGCADFHCCPCCWHCSRIPFILTLMSKINKCCTVMKMKHKDVTHQGEWF